MYLDYYGLSRDPFTISPDPGFLYPSPQHRQALAHLKYGLDREGGFILLTGEVGTGKTTLTRLLLEQLPGNVRVAYLLNAKLDTLDLLRSICQELGCEYREQDSAKALIDKINEDLLQAHAADKKTLLLIEESQNLAPDVLEMLRLLTNLETNTTKLIHILLVGQPELLELIGRNDLRQLNQRVVSRFHLEPLDLDNTERYITHRMRKAGASGSPFDRSGLAEIHKITNGVPRLLNLIGERALVAGYANGVSQVNRNLVREAATEVLGQSMASSPAAVPPRANWLLWVGGFVIVLLSVALAWVLLQQSNVQPVAETADRVSQPNAEQPQGRGFGNDGAAASQQEQDGFSPSLTTVEALSAQSNSDDHSGLSTYQRLIDLWGVSTQFIDASNLCERASIEGLVCQRDTGLRFGDLSKIDRPGIVSLLTEADRLELYLVLGLTPDAIYLSNSQSAGWVDARQFRQLWDQNYWYLWKPPPGYRNPIQQGARNRTLIYWLQTKLESLIPGYDYIIGGGVYSASIVDAVSRFQASQNLDADGVLGPRTIMRLRDAFEPTPRLTGKKLVPDLALSSATQATGPEGDGGNIEAAEVR